LFMLSSQIFDTLERSESDLFAKKPLPGSLQDYSGVTIKKQTSPVVVTAKSSDGKNGFMWVKEGSSETKTDDQSFTNFLKKLATWTVSSYPAEGEMTALGLDGKESDFSIEFTEKKNGQNVTLELYRVAGEGAEKNQPGATKEPVRFFLLSSDLQVMAELDSRAVSKIYPDLVALF